MRGKTPELWHLDTGVVEEQWLYRETADGRTTVPINLEPYGSAIVLLRPGTPAHLIDLRRDGVEDLSVHVTRSKEGRWILNPNAPGDYRAQTSGGADLDAHVPQQLAAAVDIGGPLASSLSAELGCSGIGAF